jgi:acyl-CoA synthetase (AMP-forming)/AMP-acid ligase II
VADVSRPAPDDIALPQPGRAPTTIYEILERAVARDPAGVFYVASNEAETLTYTDVRERVERAARQLASLGLEPGDRIIVWLPNGPLWIALLFASARLGTVLVTAGARLRMADMPHLIEHSKAKAIFYTPQFMETDYEAMVLQLLQLRDGGELPLLRHLIRCAEGEPPPGTTALAELEGRSELPAAPDPGSPAVICYTGGTTGSPKGCVHDHRTIVRNCTIASGLTGFAPGERLVSAMPFAHVFGFHMGVLQPMAGGASLIEAEPFAADRVLGLVEQHRATVLYGVPAMAQALVAAQKERPRDLSSLRVTLLAGAPVPAKLRSQAITILDCGLTVVYGATESPTLTQLMPDAPPTPLLESVGQATPGVELAIFEPGADRQLPVGEIGESGARGYNHMVCYLDDAEATRQKYRGEWIIPGDYGRLDEDGFLYVTGRSEDMFLCGGFNVYPREVESQLETLAGIGEVVVFGVPDEHLGEVALAFVTVDDPGLTEDDILAWAKENMASYKRPRYLRVISEMPRTHAGKTARGELRAEGRRLLPHLAWRSAT